MDNNRSAILRELTVILVILALLLTTGGFLIRNLVVGLRSLDDATLARELDSGELEKALGGFDPEKTLREFAAKILPAKDKNPAAGPKGEITAVRFFEGGQTPPAYKQRAYADRFALRAVGIYTEITYKNNSHKIADAAIPIVLQYIGPDGRQVAEIKKTAQPKKDWASAVFTAGAADIGGWRAGRYTVKVYFDGDHIGDYNFTIQ